MPGKTEGRKFLPKEIDKLYDILETCDFENFASEFTFSYDPDDQACESLSSVFMFLSALFRYPNEDIYNTTRKIIPTFKDFLEEYSEGKLTLASRDEMETEYVKLFVANIGGVPAPLYSSVYTDSEKLVKRDSTVKLKNLMESTGFAVESGIKELEDNLYIMLEYLSHLFLSFPENADENEKLRYLYAAINVTNNYIKPMLPEFYIKISEHTEISFYKEIATILYNFINDIDNIYMEVFDI
ncbi:MAG: molecular chaperone TorD family protein [Flexistipes sinusarabici]|uniref:Molecular chaperone TorD family protein n=1 Tax=Flexistipes sinusarabici TaxID=2352 RepID=A0A5D0MVR7_FLESI|nr:molecular chaperone TorD family protein [Flexistipes sinusarabici]TYB36237.1 MAG: molecular chaperone TorD family protein [Flexistipes sinusarabici]